MSHGPAFKTNYRAGPVQSIDIYELMCSELELHNVITLLIRQEF